mgnify:CR=1 FL=1
MHNTLVAFLGTALQAHFFPFEDDRENYLALAMDASMLFCLQFGLVAMADSQSLSSTPWRLVGIGLTAMTVSCILYGAKLSLGEAVGTLWQTHRQHQRDANRRRTDAAHRTTRSKLSSVMPELPAEEGDDHDGDGGSSVGDDVGMGLGYGVGPTVGTKVGNGVGGILDGSGVGEAVGAADGRCVGCGLGTVVGRSLGSGVVGGGVGPGAKGGDGCDGARGRGRGRSRVLDGGGGGGGGEGGEKGGTFGFGRRAKR